MPALMYAGVITALLGAAVFLAGLAMSLRTEPGRMYETHHQHERWERVQRCGLLAALVGVILLLIPIVIAIAQIIHSFMKGS